MNDSRSAFSSIVAVVMDRCGAPRLASTVALTTMLAFGAVCPARALDLNNLLTGYSLTSWNDGDGRPLGSVYAIVQDHDGYLWIGADAGLFRFDGSRFTPWEAMSDAGLPKSAVTALTVSRNGSVWAGFADGAGVRKIRDGVVQTPSPGLDPSGSVTDLVEDHAGTLWAVSDGVLYQLTESAWSRIDLPWPEREGHVLHMMVRSNGDLWVGTRWAIFSRRAGATSFEVEIEGYIWDLNEDASGVIWTTDIAAGFRRLGAPAPPHHSLEGAGFRLTHDHEGNLWVATFGEGLWRVHDAASAKAPIVERAALRTGLSSDSVQSLMEDRAGNIWVGTTGGLHRLTRRKLTPVENVGFVVAVEPEKDGRVFAGTTNGVVRFSTATLKWERARAGSPAPDVRSLLRDTQGALWVGTTEGVWQWADGRLVKVPVPLPGSTQVLSLALDAQRGLWIGDGDWLYRWDGAHLKPLALPRPSPGDRITLAATDRRGRLWVGLSGGGLAVVEDDGRIRSVSLNEALCHTVHKALYAIFEDHDGVIWIGGSGGLSRFTGERCDTLNSADGLPSDRVWAIVEDANNQLWLNVDRGIIRLERSEIDKAVAERTHRIQYRLYDAPDGVAGAPVGIIGAARASNGTLLFVRGGGLTLVNPADVAGDRTQPPPPLRIEAVVANERRFNAATDASFPSGTRRLQINYTALTLTGSNATRFRYRLDGFDTDWVDAGTRRAAFYTNLSPRDYRFVVEARTEDGAWAPSSASWAFSIKPAFSQTSWFYALCAGVLALGVWALWRFRLGIVRRQFTLVLAERARLSREMHDTLLQSLVGVALQFDAISRSMGPASSTARDQLLRVRRQVETYIKEARQSIWDLRSSFLDRLDLGSALREFGVNVVADKGIGFQANVVGVPHPGFSHMETQVLRIGQEAITNAIRHADPRHIWLDLKYDDQFLTLRVADDGCGFDLDSRSPNNGRHFGLTAMRERAEQVGAKFTIETGVGRGTAIAVAVPWAATADLGKESW
jgi:ligand-binding sensor domain-containing protein